LFPERSALADSAQDFFFIIFYNVSTGNLIEEKSVVFALWALFGSFNEWENDKTLLDIS